jgi:H/ACA ribonucleoprotein complex non-core subunit NAF1
MADKGSSHGDDNGGIPGLSLLSSDSVEAVDKQGIENQEDEQKKAEGLLDATPQGESSSGKDANDSEGMKEGDETNAEVLPTQSNPLLDSVDRALANEDVEFSSDEEDDNSDTSKANGSAETNSSPEQDSGSASEAVAAVNNSTESHSESSSSSSDSSDEDSSSSSDESDNEARGRPNVGVDEDEEEDNTGGGGPLATKNEILDDPPPPLPENLNINSNTPIEYVGELTQVAEKTAIIKAAVSGEFRILQDTSSVFCFEDRTVLGVLYETFGQVQSPHYAVKFDTVETAQQFVERKGQKVYYVVPASNFIFTEQVRAIKGSDASNLHDEEIPVEEQEFSDDEKEMEAKRKKKPKNKKKKQSSSNGPPSKRLANMQFRPDFDDPNYNPLQRPTQSMRPPPYYQHSQQHMPYGQPMQFQNMMPMQMPMMNYNPMYYGMAPPQFYPPQTNQNPNQGLTYDEEDDEYHP